MGVAGAITGAIGAIGAVSGVAGAVKSNKQANEAKRQADIAYNEAKSNALEQKQMWENALSDWKTMFGDVESSVTEYFNNLTPEIRQNQYFQQLESNYNASSQRLTEMLAQRGLSSSGIVASTNAELLSSLASSKAQASINAQDEVNQQKFSYLQYGQQQKNLAQQGLNDAYNNLANINTQRGNTNLQLAQQYNNQTTQSIQSGIGSLGSALGGIANSLNTSSAGASALGNVGTGSLPNYLQANQGGGLTLPSFQTYNQLTGK